VVAVTMPAAVAAAVVVDDIFSSVYIYTTG
jgi:hypothetical protein